MALTAVVPSAARPARIKAALARLWSGDAPGANQIAEQYLAAAPDVTDPVGLVPEVAQRPFDRRNRLRVIEFRRLFLSISFGEVIVPEVVCYADFHVYIFDSNTCVEKGGLPPRSGRETRGQDLSG